PGVGGPPGRRGLAGDFAGLDAGRADPDPPAVSPGAGPHDLDVRVKAARGPAVGEGDVVAESRPLAAYLADRRHGTLLACRRMVLANVPGLRLRTRHRTATPSGRAQDNRPAARSANQCRPGVPGPRGRALLSAPQPILRGHAEA